MACEAIGEPHQALELSLSRLVCSQYHSVKAVIFVNSFEQN